MVDPLSGDIVKALSEDSVGRAPGNANAFASGELGAFLLADPNALLSGPPVNLEAAAILDLVDPAVVESALIPSSLASAAAATVELSAEALAQAAAAGLPATLSDESPAFPRSAEARRATSEAGVRPISGAELWQEAIQRFQESDSSGPSRQPRPRSLPVCPWCGRIHPAPPADGVASSDESCFTHSDAPGETDPALS
jgi:hypothetical protein